MIDRADPTLGPTLPIAGAGVTTLASQPPKPVVLYDGGCALCRREIDHYRGLDRAGRVVWVDIASQGAELDRYGITAEQAMARFHVRDARGQWQTGAWGFAELWSHLPYFSALGWLLRRLRLVGPLDLAYRRFARWRLRRRQGCTSGVCGTGEQQP
jgi:predicted DCC family thiol-disulfide oxidoreductase YuxK